MEFLQNVDWTVLGGAVVATLAGIYGIVKIWVKITPNKEDDATLEAVGQWVDPILDGAQDLLDRQPKPEESKSDEPSEQ